MRVWRQAAGLPRISILYRGSVVPYANKIAIPWTLAANAVPAELVSTTASGVRLMANGSAAGVPLPDEPEQFDHVDDDFIEAVVEVGAELPDAVERSV